MAGKKINAFNELCKDIMIANMADTLKAYGGFPELEKQVYDLKACTVMEVASAVPIVQVMNLVFRVCSCMYVIATYAVVVPWKVPTTLMTTIWNRCLPCYSI